MTYIRERNPASGEFTNWLVAGRMAGLFTSPLLLRTTFIFTLHSIFIWLFSTFDFEAILYLKFVLKMTKLILNLSIVHHILDHYAVLLCKVKQHFILFQDKIYLIALSLVLLFAFFSFFSPFSFPHFCFKCSSQVKKKFQGRWRHNTMCIRDFD